MGCDIHAMKESKEHSWWKNEGEPNIGRDYELFAVLAGVRNAHDIAPISEPKGMPEDASGAFEAWHEAWESDAHSASWLSLAELKLYDQDVEVVDGRHCVRDAEGKITETHASCFGPNDGKCVDRVGRRKLFGIWNRNPLNDLIAELEELRVKRGLTDEDVRICFFFDN